MRKLLALLAVWTIHPLFAETCDKLMALKLPHTAITSAVLVPESGPPNDAPARCVVQAAAHPTSDSDIKFEVWMPADAWNGKYQQVGNGGWAGAIPVPSLTAAVRRGYAAAGTDDGHSGGTTAGAGWVVGHPEKLIDFGYRALRETTVNAKVIIRAFYGRDPQRSYFTGCSDGGREALMEAQRFPDDFDGIVAGAPANDWSHHFTGFIWNEQALLNDPASKIPASKLPLIQQGALAACDALDGVKDGLIEDPRRCHFDPAVLTCKNADGPDCLTAAQVTALRKIYAGPVNPRTGRQIYPGYPAGTEAVNGGWAAWIIGGIQSFFGNTYYGQAVFEDPKWDFRKFDFDSDVEYGDQKAGVFLNSNSPDLRSFRARGGKLIQYHGWGDAAIAPMGSIEYYERVRAFLSKYPDPRSDTSKPIDGFYRLFMVPGMGHCAGGSGPNSFGNGDRVVSPSPENDLVSALDAWVEKGTAPQRITATGVTVDNPAVKLTRPLCPYPQVAHYKGTGDVNDAANFSCEP